MSNFRYVRPDSFPPLIKNLIIINVLVWVAQLALHSRFNLTDFLALAPVDLPEFKPYQIVTHMFAHASFSANRQVVISHILFNMFTLWMFGRVLENFWGPKRLLFFYLACGIGAALCHLLVQHLRYDPVIVQEIIRADAYGDQEKLEALIPRAGFLASAVGASGAIMGVMVAFAYLFPNTEFVGMFIPIPIKAKWLILMLVAADLFGGFSYMSTDNIAHFAHLGGALTGFILVLIWNKTNRKSFY